MLQYGLRAATYGPRCAECQNSLGLALEAASFALSLQANLEAQRLTPLIFRPTSTLLCTSDISGARPRLEGRWPKRSDWNRSHQMLTT